MAPFELLATLERLTPQQLTQRKETVRSAAEAAASLVAETSDGNTEQSQAERILANAQHR